MNELKPTVETPNSPEARQRPVFIPLVERDVEKTAAPIKVVRGDGRIEGGWRPTDIKMAIIEDKKPVVTVGVYKAIYDSEGVLRTATKNVSFGLVAKANAWSSEEDVAGFLAGFEVTRAQIEELAGQKYKEYKELRAAQAESGPTHDSENSSIAEEALSVESSNQSIENFSQRTQLLATPLNTDSRGNKFGQIDDNAPGKYDHLFDVDAYDDVPLKSVEVAAVRLGDRDKVNQENIARAEENLESIIDSNLNFRRAIEEYIDPNGGDLIDQVRGNHILRCALVEEFDKSLEHFAAHNYQKLPERVRYNSRDNLKEVAFVDYPVRKVTSREYVVLLMLAMVDGSFDHSRSRIDRVESHRNHDGTPGYGQHREAASMVLSSMMGK